jgi:hypothetical protein
VEGEVAREVGGFFSLSVKFSSKTIILKWFNHFSVAKSWSFRYMGHVHRKNSRPDRKDHPLSSTFNGVDQVNHHPRILAPTTLKNSRQSHRRNRLQHRSKQR